MTEPLPASATSDSSNAEVTGNASRLDLLPVEIIVKILKLTWSSQGRCLGERTQWRYDSGAYISTHISLNDDALALLHVSSRLRAIALTVPIIRHTIAEALFVLAADKQQQQCLCLLPFCSEQVDEASSSAAFEAFYTMAPDHSSQKLLDLIGHLMPTATKSLRELHLLFPLRLSSSSDVASQMKQEEVIGAAFDLLSKASSLSRLVLHCHDLHPLELLAARGLPVDAKPRSLQINLAAPQPRSDKLKDFLGHLASQAHDLSLNVTRRHITNQNIEDDLVDVVLRAASKVVKRLEIIGMTHTLGISKLLYHSFDNLEKLSIWLRDPDQIRWRNVVRSLGSFPLLRELEGPFWLISHLQAPHLKRLGATFLEARRSSRIRWNESADENMLRDSLEQWPELEDLALHSETRDSLSVTDLFHGILQSLTIYDPESVLCPALRRISLSARLLDSIQWILDTAFDDPSLPPHLLYVAASQPKRSEPVGLGLKLLRFAQSRCLTRSTPLASIRILDCVVVPMVWQLVNIVCKGENYCCPDPLGSFTASELPPINDDEDSEDEAWYYHTNRMLRLTDEVNERLAERQKSGSS